MLGLSETGASGGLYDFPITGAGLANGWYLITAMQCDHAIRSEAVLRELSSMASAIACSIEKHVMFMSPRFGARARKSGACNTEAATTV